MRCSTLVGDFCVDFRDQEKYNLGIISNVSETAGFATFISRTSEGFITEKSACQFLEAMISLFPFSNHVDE